MSVCVCVCVCVGSEDLLLHHPHEMLRRGKISCGRTHSFAKPRLERLAEIRNHKDDCAVLCEQFGEGLKLGAHAHSANRPEVADLSRHHIHSRRPPY